MRLITLMVFSCVLAAQDWKPAQSVNNVLQIAVLNPNPPVKMTAYGTGFFVRSDGLIATAGHVYLAAMSGIVEAHGGILIGQRFTRDRQSAGTPLDFVAQDYAHDIALLRLRAIDPAWKNVGGVVPIALEQSSTMEDDSRVGMRGYFGSDNFTVFLEGKVCGIAEMAPGVHELLVMLPVAPGQSGSPIVSMETGRVVGIAVSIVPTPLPFVSQQLAHSGMTRVVEVEHLNMLIESLSK